MRIRDNTVVCRLPRTGLGNQLFPLLRSMIFAQINQLPHLVTGYHIIKPGPFLRGEKSKRRYANSFVFEKGPFGEWLDRMSVAGSRLKRVKNPEWNAVVSAADPALFIFDEIPHWRDYFISLKRHRSIVKSVIRDCVRPEILTAAMDQPSPVIGVHIRMGDYRKLSQHEDFSKVGTVRTPEDYFVDVINAVRRCHGSDVPVSIFTDGYRHEFTQILDLPAVKIVEGNRDIVDLLLLSRSKLIITSAGSTFSYWAGFLSDVPVIIHPDHFHGPLRDPGDGCYDGPWNESDVRLSSYVKSLPASGRSS